MWVIKFDKTSQSEAVLTRALISHILSHYVSGHFSHRSYFAYLDVDVVLHIGIFLCKS